MGIEIDNRPLKIDSFRTSHSEGEVKIILKSEGADFSDAALPLYFRIRLNQLEIAKKNIGREGQYLFDYDLSKPVEEKTEEQEQE